MIRLRLDGAAETMAARLTERAAERWPGAVTGPDDPAAAGLAVAVDGLDEEAAWFAVSLQLAVALAGDSPARAIPTRPGGGLSRRGLFSILSPDGGGADDTGPRLDLGACQSLNGCDQCVRACPPGALAVVDGRLAIDPGLCQRCGACAAACPVAAIEHPPWSRRAFAAVLAVVGAAARGRDVALVLSCAREPRPVSPWVAWAQVPGVAAVGERLLCRAAASGAKAVVVHCPDGACGQRRRGRQAVAAVAAALAGRGPDLRYVEGPAVADAIRQALAAGHRLGPPPDQADLWAAFDASARAVAAPGTEARRIGYTGVKVSPACTSCGACVWACPRQALALDQGRLTFRTAACTACGACVGRCPERAISLGPAGGTVAELSLPALAHQDQLARCGRCGSVVGPRAMLRRVAAILGTPAFPEDMCPTCKAGVTWR